jgi:PqqD family protein of HPr-rel-A system
MEPSLRYRLRGAERLRQFVFDDEVVAFDEATWETHVLHRSASIVIEALANGPATMPELERTLHRHAESPHLAASVISELSGIELVEPVPIAASR